MNALIIFLVGLILMSADPQIPQIVKTIVWVLLIFAGLILGALSSFPDIIKG